MVRLWKSIRKFPAAALIISFAVASLGKPCLAVAPRSLAGHVVSATGKVLARFGSEQARELQAGSAFNEGDVINTASNGSAKLLFLDKSIADLGPTAMFHVKEFKQSGQADERQAEIEMGYGKVRIAVSRKLQGHSKFQIKTPTATLGVRGTEFIISHVPQGLNGGAMPKGAQTIGVQGGKPGKTEVVVLQGRVDLAQNIGRLVANAGAKPQVISLTAGQKLVADSFGKSEFKPVQLNVKEVSDALASAKVEDNTFKRSISIEQGEKKKPAIGDALSTTVAVALPHETQGKASGNGAPSTEPANGGGGAHGFEGTFGSDQALKPPSVVVPAGGLKHVQVVITE